MTLVVLAAAPAMAHAGFDVRQLGAGATETFELRVPIEVDSTNASVDVLVPEGWTVADCPPPEGWTCDLTGRDDGTTVVSLAADDESAGGVERFTLTMTAAPEQGTYSFPVVQTYADGTEAAWVGEPGSDRPAPVVVVDGSSSAVDREDPPTSHGDPDDVEVDDGETSEDEGTTPPTDDTTAPPTDGAGAPTDRPSVDDAEPIDDADGAAGATDDGGTGGALVAIGVVAVIAVAAAAVTAGRRRRG